MSHQTRARSEKQTSNHLYARMAEKFNVDPGELVSVLKATAFRQKKGNVSDEQLTALLIVADQYNLNPFTKEIYAYPDKFGGIVPVVGVDGWNRIANEHPQFDGVQFNYSPDLLQANGALSPCHAWIECIVYRKDRSHPSAIREYLDECYKDPSVDDWGNVKAGPWQTHPKRLLRHKTLIQGYRINLGFVGIYDEDEAMRILDAQNDDNGSAVNIVALKRTELPAMPKSLEIKKAQPFVVPNDDFDKASVDQFLTKLVQRATKTNQWQAAKDLVEERLVGEAQSYAMHQLDAAQASVIDGTLSVVENGEGEVALHIEAAPQNEMALNAVSDTELETTSNGEHDAHF